MQKGKFNAHVRRINVRDDMMAILLVESQTQEECRKGVVTHVHLLERVLEVQRAVVKVRTKMDNCFTLASMSLIMHDMN